MIAQGLAIGISKHELLNDYYPGEIEAIFEEHNVIHGVEKDEYEDVDMMDLFSEGAGEWQPK